MSRRSRTPHWSLLALYIGSSALVFWSGGLDKALSIAVFSYLIAYFSVSCTAAYVLLARPELRERAAFKPKWWFALSLIVGVVGSAALIVCGAHWPVLFQGHFGELSTLAVYITWLVLGLIIFAIYWLIGQRRGDDMDAICDTIPGVAGG